MTNQLPLTAFWDLISELESQLKNKSINGRNVRNPSITVCMSRFGYIWRHRKVAESGPIEDCGRAD